MSLSFADSLLSRAGLLLDTKAGSALAMDSTAEEQAHGITIKSSGVSLALTDWRFDDAVVNDEERFVLEL